MKHVISDGRADREFAKSIEGFIRRSYTNDLVVFSLQHFFPEHEVRRAVLDAKDERSKWCGLFDEEGTKRSRPSSLKLVGRVHTGKAVLH